VLAHGDWRSHPVPVDFEEAMLRCYGADRWDKEEELRAVICFLFTDMRLLGVSYPNSTSVVLRV
jgi:hypothetical protein